MRARSLLLTAPRRLAWVDGVLPAPRGREVLVETVAGAISIGSEVPLYLGNARSASPIAYPRMTGYESLGVVVACGDAVERLAVGDAVLAFYGHRTHAVLPEWRTIAVDRDLDARLALAAILTCDVGKGIRAVQAATDGAGRPVDGVIGVAAGRTDALPWGGEPALVAGGGAIGLFTLWMLVALGAETVDVVEPLPSRRALAMEIGARRAVHPADAAALDERYPVAFECSGRDAAFALLQARLARRGRLCVLSDGNVEGFSLAPAFHANELRIVGSSDGWDYPAHTRWYLDAVRRGERGLARVFDLEIAIDALPATFERLARERDAAIKVLVRY